MPKLFKKDQPRRSAAREQLTAPPKYYRAGQLREQSSSPFKPKPKKNPRFSKALYGLADITLLLLLGFGLIYSMLVKPDPKVLASSSAYRPAAAYQKAAIKQFQMLKNRNKVSLDEQGIIDAMQAQFPEIADADVELPLFSETPLLHLNISKPAFFLSSSGHSYIVDGQGTVVAESTTLPDIKNLTQVVDQSGFKTKVGSQTLSAGDVAFINTVVAQAKRARVPVASLTLPNLAQELDLRTTDHGYFIKFYLGGDPLIQSGQFLAARHDFDQTGKQPSQYLDVRVTGKIFYK